MLSRKLYIKMKKYRDSRPNQWQIMLLKTGILITSALFPDGTLTKYLKNI